MHKQYKFIFLNWWCMKYSDETKSISVALLPHIWHDNHCSWKWTATLCVLNIILINFCVVSLLGMQTLEILISNSNGETPLVGWVKLDNLHPSPRLSLVFIVTQLCLAYFLSPLQMHSLMNILQNCDFHHAKT